MKITIGEIALIVIGGMVLVVIAVLMAEDSAAVIKRKIKYLLPWILGIIILAIFPFYLPKGTMESILSIGLFAYFDTFDNNFPDKLSAAKEPFWECGVRPWAGYRPKDVCHLGYLNAPTYSLFASR